MIFIGIPSRDRPESLLLTLNLIDRNSYNKDSYFIYITIDDDQKGLYGDVISEKECDNIKFNIMAKHDAGMRSIFMNDFEKFLESDRYFYFPLPDDIKFIYHRWDKYICEKRGYFSDDLFAMHSRVSFHAREEKPFKICYSENIIDDEIFKMFSRFWDINDELVKDFFTVYHRGEMFPVYSRKFVDYLKMAFSNDKNIVGIDIMGAFLIQQLYKIYRINRHVRCLPCGCRCIDDKKTDDMITDNPIDIYSIRNIIDKMYKYIKNENS